MKSKTWKLGEVAKGGIITVEIAGKIITIIGKDWDFSAGSNKGSNQSNAKEFTRGTVEVTDPQAHRKVSQFLNDLTTHYYAEMIMDWMEENSQFKKLNFW